MPSRNSLRVHLDRAEFVELGDSPGADGHRRDQAPPDSTTLPAFRSSPRTVKMLISHATAAAVREIRASHRPTPRRPRDAARPTATGLVDDPEIEERNRR